MPPMARLRMSIFNKFGDAYLISKGKMSTWSGGKTNIPVRASIRNGQVTRVFINDKWWTVDPLEWRKA